MNRTLRWAGLLIAILTVGARAGDEPRWTLASKLYADRTARHVGDILTVVIVETSSSSKDNEKATDKLAQHSGAISFGSPLVDGKPPVNWTNVALPNYSLDAKNKFSGKGTMANKDEFSGTIGVRVTEVLPNGNLLIEGRRSLDVQDERVDVILTGTVRPEDVARDNTVPSTRVADAAIQYHSTGSLARSQNKGLLTKLWDWVNPF